MQFLSMHTLEETTQGISTYSSHPKE